jgi:hypothetical protein
MVFFSLFAGSYCIASGIHSYIRYKNILNKNNDGQNKVIFIPGNINAVEFIGYKNYIDYPIYVEVGNSGINMPIGEGLYDEEEFKLFSKIHKNYLNYKII